ncbi:hypothetical protein [Halotia branconii]|uniref:Uncharacterized protein n=1 Tax=Halotia branconii CENA392 TaxID=1539056 RepID=A0AAJ6P812_9CYAN|nr:hypothetical protein [Halotia branconii]WGV24210.1 hypothetical protein QI031_20755 [Halotia branconii CENA392]
MLFTPASETTASFPQLPPPPHPACTQPPLTSQLQSSAASPNQTNPSQQIEPARTPASVPPCKQPQTQPPAT